MSTEPPGGGNPTPDGRLRVLLIDDDPGAGFLGKPFRHLGLACRVRNLLDGRE